MFTGIIFSCTQRPSIVERCRGTERLISSLSSTPVLSLSPYQRKKWGEKWEQQEIMHIGDIYFPFFFPDNGLLFQALLSAVFACGMISITTFVAGMPTCPHFKTTSATLWRWKLTSGWKKKKEKKEKCSGADILTRAETEACDRTDFCTATRQRLGWKMWVGSKAKQSQRLFIPPPSLREPTFNEDIWSIIHRLCLLPTPRE